METRYDFLVPGLHLSNNFTSEFDAEFCSENSWRGIIYLPSVIQTRKIKFLEGFSIIGQILRVQCDMPSSISGLVSDIIVDVDEGRQFGGGVIEHVDVAGTRIVERRLIAQKYPFH